MKGHDSKAEFEKNVQSVTRILGALPAGAKVTVIGITDAFKEAKLSCLAMELRRPRTLMRIGTPC